MWTELTYLPFKYFEEKPEITVGIGEFGVSLLSLKHLCV